MLQMSAAYWFAHSWLAQPTSLYNSGPHGNCWCHSQPPGPSYTNLRSRKMPNRCLLGLSYKGIFLIESIFPNDSSLCQVNIKTNQHDTFAQSLKKARKCSWHPATSVMALSTVDSELLSLSWDIVVSCCSKSLALWYFLPIALGNKRVLF